MGAQEFSKRQKGESAKEAFITARDQALYENGHRGYTGSLAEKSEFQLVPFSVEHLRAKIDDYRKENPGPSHYGWDPTEQAEKVLGQMEETLKNGGELRSCSYGYCDALLSIDRTGVGDKWGPAGCLELGEGEYLFFGVSPS